MERDLWVKMVDNPILRPLNEWRDELYDSWMVVTDMEYINGEKMAIARYYGTDKEKLYALYNELHDAANEPTVSILLNKRSNWMGGVFLAKTEG